MANIALNKATASSSFVMPYTAANTVNGTITPFSRWLCNTVPGWMSVNLGAKYLVNRWVVRHMPVAGWQVPNYAISDFKLQGSNDNTTWNDIDSVVGNTLSITDRTFGAIAIYQYYRVYVTKGLNTNTQLASIMEFELYQAYSTQLTNLAISVGTLAPVFNTNTFAYSATVTPIVASINITPTAQDPQAVIKVNNAVVASGQPKAVSLTYGSNTITVNVTDGSGAQKNYVITVTRPGNNLLSNLTAQSGSTNIPLVPGFDKGNLAYTALVGFDIATLAVTPTAEKSDSTIKVNGVTVTSGTASTPIPLNVGVNNISIAVTNAGDVLTYTIAVTRVDTSLSMLVVKALPAPLAFTPAFQSLTFVYVAASTPKPSVVVTPTAQLAASVVKVNDTQITPTAPNVTVTLATGSNIIKITVTNSGATTTYQVTVPKS